MKYHFHVNVVNYNFNNAGSKAVNDCIEIFDNLGYKGIRPHFHVRKGKAVQNAIKMLGQLVKAAFKIKPGSLIVVQYPISGINKHFKHFIKILKFKKCFFVCLIHDVDAIRFQKPEHEIFREIEILNAYNVVISHNEKMTEWLRSHFLKTKIINLQVFDYLYANENQFNRLSAFAEGNREIVFAGTIGRGSFIYDLDRIAKNIAFSLYGPLYPGTDIKTIENQQQVNWEGSFSPDELVEKLKGNFGLIWDGNSIEQCEGELGDYIAFNNPHKTSLYFAAGLPVILPSKAALSKFVLDNNLGLTVNSLLEIDGALKNISDDQYAEMLKNVASVKNKLKKGYFLQSALAQAEAVTAFDN